MHVIKRNGVRAPFIADKIGHRIKKLAYNLDISDDQVNAMVRQTERDLSDDNKTTDIDDRLANVIIQLRDAASAKSKERSVFGTLAARVKVSNLHKKTIKKFTDVYQLLASRSEEITSRELDFAQKHEDVLNSSIISARDYDLTYEEITQLETQNLLRVDGVIVERPGHRYMRLAIQKHISQPSDTNTDETLLQNIIDEYDHQSKRSLT